MKCPECNETGTGHIETCAVSVRARKKIIRELCKKVEFLCRDAEDACVECGWNGHEPKCGIGRLLTKARA